MSVLSVNKWLVERTKEQSVQAGNMLETLKEKLQEGEESAATQTCLPLICSIIDSLHSIKDNASTILDVIENEVEPQEAQATYYQFTTFRKKGKSPIEEVVEVVEE